MSPADLRGTLHADAVSLALCGLLLLTGTFALGMAGVLRQRAAPLLWLAAFSHLYGLRLLIRTGTFRLYLDVPRAAWDFTDAAMTYAVPIPILFFARAAFPAWRRFWTVGASGLTVFAVYGIASDAMLDRPFSVEAANNVIAIAFFIGVVGWIFRPGLTPSRELRTIRAGALAVSLTAVADNLRGMGALRFPGPDLEPIGFTVLIACLATIAVRRVIADAQQLVAINRELDIARQIQASLVPQTMPRILGLTIAARYRPMTAVAGDFYDFLEIDAQRLGILVADVSGHGVPAALIASMVKVAFAAQRERAESPAAVLAGLNRTLCGQLAGQYVTAAYLFVDSRARLIRYAAAGHPPMLRFTREDGRVHEVVQNGLLLGFVPDIRYEEAEQPLRGGDRFLLYTDGLIEACNAGDDLFGLERLKASLAQAATLHPHAVTDTLVSTVDAWSGLPPGDDLTLVLVDWTSAGRSGASTLTSVPV
jgi:sigma-B regulation protein RsbU (phosphoserine phosphatase)